VRRLVGLCVLAAASGALATPASQLALTWADWVGDWEGKLAWTSCSAEGEARATLPLDATDGSVAIDLSPAGSALAQLSLVEDGDGWTGREADVTVHVRRTRSDKLALTVDLDSGCQIRGTLSRASVGIAACDRLAAWARIESHCTKLARPPLENAARLARQRAEWRKARRDDRAKLAAQCTARSSKVEQELIDAGCAPHPDPAIGMRGAECKALHGISARLSRCGTLPSDQRDAYLREILVLLAAAQGADAASLPIVDGECKRTRERLFAIAQQAGCPP
jgi:hypothetical protein